MLLLLLLQTGVTCTLSSLRCGGAPLTCWHADCNGSNGVHCRSPRQRSATVITSPPI